MVRDKSARHSDVTLLAGTAGLSAIVLGMKEQAAKSPVDRNGLEISSLQPHLSTDSALNIPFSFFNLGCTIVAERHPT